VISMVFVSVTIHSVNLVKLILRYRLGKLWY